MACVYSHSENIAKPPYLILSGHDFRSKRKANIHFIAKELSALGQTRFFSVGFSIVSILKKDPRAGLWGASNSVHSYEGVDCYLWRSTLHPFNVKRIGLGHFSGTFFKNYIRHAPQVLKNWIEQSNTILIESGMSIIFFKYIKNINPNAIIIYIASDSLHTINADRQIVNALDLHSMQLDGIRLPSESLRKDFSNQAKLKVIPHGFDNTVLKSDKQSPYSSDKNIISVGSMLFDRVFFEIACPSLPEFNFFIIGGGHKARGLNFPNLKIIDEMPFEQTIPYIKHADIGLAAYEIGKVDQYLTDTSMKLIQYAALGIPAVCPATVAGKYPWRFGYAQCRADYIVAKVKEAANFGKFDGIEFPAWDNITRDIITLNYKKHQDTNTS